MRPISALVDITNFLTFDLCRPLHVFDAAKLQGDLALRGARPHEKLRALDGKEYALDGDMTVIADNSGAISLGGVIGGDPAALGHQLAHPAGGAPRLDDADVERQVWLGQQPLNHVG